MQEIYQDLQIWAQASAQILLDYYNRSFTIHKKGVIDLVTDADLASEQYWREQIRHKYPDHQILAEENGWETSQQSAEFCWVIDPLDGTTNFAHHYPMFCVSAAIQQHGKTIAGCVVVPYLKELFLATENGAFLNDRPIQVSTTNALNDALIATGFPYNRREKADVLTQTLQRMMCAAQAIRRDGSAALNLCYVACGRFDGFYEENLKPWDTAASAFIAQQAGARIATYQNQAWNEQAPHIVCANPQLLSPMISILNQ